MGDVLSCRHMANDLRAEAGALLTKWLGRTVEARAVKPVGGGCVNDVAKVETSAGPFFLKSNTAARYPGLFESEAKGLALLRAANAVPVPGVIGHGERNGRAWLALEWIEAGPRRKDYFDDFGRRLAALHRHTNGRFGLDHDNYIGSLPQSNRRHAQGADFFSQERLAPQVERAARTGALKPATARRFEKLYDALPGLLPDEPPALLHGDLWSGNCMTGAGGGVCLVDPAVYYGHREADLAMTMLFGGFAPEFYNAYAEAFPPEKNWQRRAGLFNLYPLLVHVNLFGGGYAAQAEAILNTYTGPARR
jgi:fructosamine-3-kinase